MRHGLARDPGRRRLRHCYTSPSATQTLYERALQDVVTSRSRTNAPRRRPNRNAQVRGDGIERTFGSTHSQRPPAASPRLQVESKTHAAWCSGLDVAVFFACDKGQLSSQQVKVRSCERVIAVHLNELLHPLRYCTVSLPASQRAAHRRTQSRQWDAAEEIVACVPAGLQMTES